MKQVIVMRKDLNMRKGKMCAQAGHASQYLSKWLLHEHRDLYEQWYQDGNRKIVVGVKDGMTLLDLVKQGESAGLIVQPVRDFGLTEFHGQETLTCASFFGEDADVDAITGHLKLL